MIDYLILSIEWSMQAGPNDLIIAFKDYMA